MNGKLRDECLNQEIFYSLKEAQVVIEQWRNHFNTIRPHSIARLLTTSTADIQPNCFNWISVLTCSSLYPAGPKYPSGQYPDP